MYTIAYTTMDNTKTICLDKTYIPIINNSDKFFYYDSNFNSTSRKLVCSFNNEVHRLKKNGTDVVLEKLDASANATTVYTFSNQDWICGALLKIETMLIIIGMSSSTIYYYIWNGNSITHTSSCSNSSSISIEDIIYSNNKLYIMSNNTMYDGFLGSGILRNTSVNNDLLGASFFIHNNRIFCIAPKIVRIYELINSSLYESYYNNTLSVINKRSSGIYYNGKTIIAFPFSTGTAFLEYNGYNFTPCYLSFPVCSILNPVHSDFYLNNNNELFYFMNCSINSEVMFRMSDLKCFGNISNLSSSWNYI